MVPWHSRHSVPVPGASPLNKSGSAPGSSSDSGILALATPDDLVKLDLYGTLAEKHVGLTRRQVRLMYRDVRERTERVFAGLTPEQLRGKSRVRSTRWTGASDTSRTSTNS